ncbi:type VI secretion system baseplate subunit TssG [Pantoea sp. SO10]|uniref:type VI secretion system baseplate subunit TssG n=1 Tax=Pantoea sp. SO10 TaxID=2575375 RepID=UPI0010C9E635|nr:type VI secretion system baseplate subunit TssG [Pantoea sp. SO10]QCP59328.1 type VI secretion system baseplate subunit TssG [Pantoea sp. SO10]
MDLNRHAHQQDFYQQVRALLKQRALTMPSNKAQLLDEAMSFISPLSLDAPVEDIGSLTVRQDGRLEVEVMTQGLTGAVGALPAVYTEWLTERHYRYGDRAGKAFFDMFTHRLQCLRYLAWEKYHYYAFAELREAMPLAEATQALCGVLHEPSVLSNGRYASLLAPAVRSMVNLEALLKHAFAVPVRITPFQRQWRHVDINECCQLGNVERSLADAPMLGQQCWEQQNTFRLQLGPLNANQAMRFFPGERELVTLSNLVHTYLGPGLEFDIELEITQNESRATQLNNSQLGRNACLGDKPGPDVRRLCIPKELTRCLD